MENNSLPRNEAIRSLVRVAVESFAEGFRARHEGEVDNPEGTINMKIHNVFISALGPEIQYYTSLVRSFDSSLGNMLEKLAISIAKFSYQVETEVQGPLGLNQTREIAELLESYKRREGETPKISDYQILRDLKPKNKLKKKRHVSDYYLLDRETRNHYLVELKIGGDLDNKKARSEKEALLEQFAILSNSLSEKDTIKIYFATAYNKYGEDKPWRQERVKQYFAEEELLIGKEFWNFICKSDDGYEIVLNAYKENSDYIMKALDSIKDTYLK